MRRINGFVKVAARLFARGLISERESVDGSNINKENEVGFRAAAQELLPLSRERAPPPDFPNSKDVGDPLLMSS